MATPAPPPPDDTGPSSQTGPETRLGDPASTQMLTGLGAFNVQTAAIHWVFGLPQPGTDDPPSHPLSLSALVDVVERLSLDTTRAADWVPRVPKVLPGLLKSLRDEHSSVQDLALQIEQDVTLLAEALKTANSAMSARSQPVTQTQEAVRLIGLQGLRLLIARVAFRPVLGPDAGPLTQAGAARVWSLGESCSEAARALAPARGVDPFEAFLAGLALNVGQLVALRMADKVAHLARTDDRGLGPKRFPVGERQRLSDLNHAAQDVAHAAAILSHRVAARWELPEAVVGFITAQIDPLARAQWPAAADLLAHAQEAARLKALAEAGLLPGPLTDCWHHLPPDAQAWLAQVCDPALLDDDRDRDATIRMSDFG